MASQGIKEGSRRGFLGDFSLAGAAVILGLKSNVGGRRAATGDDPDPYPRCADYLLCTRIYRRRAVEGRGNYPKFSTSRRRLTKARPRR